MDLEWRERPIIGSRKRTTCRGPMPPRLGNSEIVKCAKRLGVRRLDAAFESARPAEYVWAAGRRRQAAALQGAFGASVLKAGLRYTLLLNSRNNPEMLPKIKHKDKKSVARTTASVVRGFFRRRTADRKNGGPRYQLPIFQPLARPLFPLFPLPGEREGGEGSQGEGCFGPSER